jgi:hypothetical protein
MVNPCKETGTEFSIIDAVTESRDPTPLFISPPIMCVPVRGRLLLPFASRVLTFLIPPPLSRCAFVAFLATMCLCWKRGKVQIQVAQKTKTHTHTQTHTKPQESTSFRVGFLLFFAARRTPHLPKQPLLLLLFFTPLLKARKRKAEEASKRAYLSHIRRKATTATRSPSFTPTGSPKYKEREF